MIFLTASSSFTGFNFAQEISQKKKLICFLSKKKNQYLGIRLKRINFLKRNKNIIIVYDCPFGSLKMINIMKKYSNIIFCFHHAHTLNYKNDSLYEMHKGYASDLNNIDHFFLQLKKNIKKLILTSSIFEKRFTGKENDFSKYALNKSLTYETIKFFCTTNKIKFINFVISNPFGPFEDTRFTNYILNCWLNNKSAIINHPNLIRENIYISDLKISYNKVVTSNKLKMNEIIINRGMKCSNLSFVKYLKRKLSQFSNRKKKYKIVSRNKLTNEPNNISFKGFSTYKIKDSDLRDYFNYYKIL